MPERWVDRREEFALSSLGRVDDGAGETFISYRSRRGCRYVGRLFETLFPFLLGDCVEKGGYRGGKVGSHVGDIVLAQFPRKSFMSMEQSSVVQRATSTSQRYVRG